MPIQAGAIFTCVSWDVPPELDRVHLSFVCKNPGPGMETDYTITITDAEIAAVTNMTQARALVQGKLNRFVRGGTLKAKLDLAIGQSWTVA